MPDDIAEALEHERPRFAAAGVPRVLYFPALPSTNDTADALADSGAPEWTTVVAEQQTAGRGRLGRTWFSPPGAGLYVSTIIRPDTDPDGWSEVPSAAFITLAAGVALAEAVRACTHLPVEIKWPNDLVVGRRKLAGILSEAAGGIDIRYIIVGFGLNLRSAAYPPDIADRATSIEAELGRPIDRGLILASSLASLVECTSVLRNGDTRAILDNWRSLSPSAHGSLVEWATSTGQATGQTFGIDDDGALLVKAGDRIERVFAGEIHWL